jgi:hypothetical protein
MAPVQGNELLARFQVLQASIDALPARQAHNALALSLADIERRMTDPKRLTRAYAQVYSQNCEDGFIAEIFARIGTGSRTFLEIGIGNGLENTTRLLLEQGWTGTWIEGDPNQARQARQIFAKFIADGALQIVHAMVTRDNINGLLDGAAVPPELDYISVDVDQNTGHIWRALDRKARAACIEYNASIPPALALEVPYDASAMWDGSNHFGASLKALELIGTRKGMRLVGCDPQGVNGYFVADGEVQDRFCAPFTAENHYQLPMFDCVGHVGHRPAPTARRWQLTIEAESR